MFFYSFTVMKEFFLKIWPWVKNKYILTISVFTIWMLFFDQYNAVDRLKMSGEIRQLEADRRYYLEEIEIIPSCFRGKANIYSDQNIGSH